MIRCVQSSAWRFSSWELLSADEWLATFLKASPIPSPPKRKPWREEFWPVILSQNNNETLCFELDFFEIIPANRYGVSVNLFLVVASDWFWIEFGLKAVLSGRFLCQKKRRLKWLNGKKHAKFLHAK